MTADVAERRGCRLGRWKGEESTRNNSTVRSCSSTVQWAGTGARKLQKEKSSITLPSKQSGSNVQIPRVTDFAGERQEKRLAFIPWYLNQQWDLPTTPNTHSSYLTLHLQNALGLIHTICMALCWTAWPKSQTRQFSLECHQFRSHLCAATVCPKQRGTCSQFLSN